MRLNGAARHAVDRWRNAVPLTQSQLVTAVADRADLSKADAKRAIGALEDVVVDALAVGRQIARDLRELAERGRIEPEEVGMATSVECHVPVGGEPFVGAAGLALARA